MPENNQILSLEGQLCGIPLAGPESFSQQQLDYLKRALGVDETVLWEGSSTPPSGDTQLTLSITFNESVANFQYVDVYWIGDHDNRQVTRCYVTSGYFFFGTRWPENNYSKNWFMMKRRLR